MTEIFSKGIILTIVGMGSVFFFLSFISFLVFLMKKFFKEKKVTINIQAKPQSDLQNLEKIAAISAAILFINDRHSSLTNSVKKTETTFKYLNWMNR